MYRAFEANRWDTVAFSDESSFTVRPTTLRKRVWRTSGTRFNNENLVPMFKSGFVSISVWAAFSARVRTPLIRINGTLHKYKYQTILESTLKPFIQRYHTGNNQFIFQQDGSGPHRAESIKAHIDANHINLMNWPAHSPDLNPIENLWVFLKRTLRKKTTYPTNSDILFERLCDIWNAIPDNYFSALIESMPPRACLVLKKRRCYQVLIKKTYSLNLIMFLVFE